MNEPTTLGPKPITGKLFYPEDDIGWDYHTETDVPPGGMTARRAHDQALQHFVAQVTKLGVDPSQCVYVFKVEERLQGITRYCFSGGLPKPAGVTSAHWRALNWTPRSDRLPVAKGPPFHEMDDRWTPEELHRWRMRSLAGRYGIALPPFLT